MSRLIRCLPLLIAVAAPLQASAGVCLELSAGAGARVDPTPVERAPTNVMLAAGYSFPIVKFELGFLSTLADVKDSKVDLQLRPMIVISPPLIPLYVRGVAGVSGLNLSDQEFIYGGALGTSFGLLGVGAFLEAGAIADPVKVATPTGSRTETQWIAEGRLGISWN